MCKPIINYLKFEDSTFVFTISLICRKEAVAEGRTLKAILTALQAGPTHLLEVPTIIPIQMGVTTTAMIMDLATIVPHLDKEPILLLRQEVKENE